MDEIAFIPEFSTCTGNERSELQRFTNVRISAKTVNTRNFALCCHFGTMCVF